MADVNRLLSSSYLKSNNQGKAAESLEALAKNEKIPASKSRSTLASGEFIRATKR